MKSFLYDMHVHTSEVSPCGKVSSSDLVHMYKKAGYQGVVITDHYYEAYFESLKCSTWEEKVHKYLEGYRKASGEGRKAGLDVILGIELRFQGSINDYLVYGVDEDFLLKNKELYTLDLCSFKELIKDKDILIYQAHPYRFDGMPASPALLDGIEVYNGNPRHESRNSKAFDFARENNLKMISGSDFHNPEDLALGGIMIPERLKDQKQLVNFLKMGKIDGMVGMDHVCT